MNKLLIILSILLFACNKEEKPLFFDQLQGDIPLTVSAIITTDSIYVCINKSIARDFSNPNEEKPVFNSDTTSTVSIYKDEQLYTKLKLKHTYVSDYDYQNKNKYYYVANIENEPGKYYTLKINNPKFGVISATTYLPKPVDSIRVDTQNINTITDADTFPITKVNLRFVQIDDKTNYFRIKCANGNERQLIEYDESVNEKIYLHLVTELGGDIFCADKNEFKNSNFSLLLGNNYTDSTTISIKSQNIDCIKYLKSLIDKGNSLSEPFAKPINIYSNVTNAYGVFYAISSRKILLSSYLK